MVEEEGFGEFAEVFFEFGVEFHDEDGVDAVLFEGFGGVEAGGGDAGGAAEDSCQVVEGGGGVGGWRCGGCGGAVEEAADGGGVAREGEDVGAVQGEGGFEGLTAFFGVQGADSGGDGAGFVGLHAAGGPEGPGRC